MISKCESLVNVEGRELATHGNISFPVAVPCSAFLPIPCSAFSSTLSILLGRVYKVTRC